MESNPEKIESKHIGVDMISELPDPILGKILSFLPTKNAVATSILSTRWKNLSPFWTQPIKLDLDDSIILHYNELDPDGSIEFKLDRVRVFTRFLDKLFDTMLLDVSHVEFMKLYCDKDYGDEKTLSWVSAVLKRNVHELLLRVCLNESKALFRGLNGCETLTRLELGKGFTAWFTVDFSLPNLKELLFFQVMFDDRRMNVFGYLIERCPKLDDLCLTDCKFQCWDLVISAESSSLKKFAVLESWNGMILCNFQLHFPNLEVLQYSDGHPGRFLSCFTSLRAAHIAAGLSIKQIDTFYEETGYNGEEEPLYSRYIAGLVFACSSTFHLYLASFTIHAVQHSPMQLPLFQNLTSLALGCLLRTEGWTLLARLLNRAPNLEKLTFEEGFGDHEEGYAWFESTLPDPPTCLDLHLREIKFKVFNEEEGELKLIEYFLMNGKVLQKLELCCLPFMHHSTLSKLLMLPTPTKIDFQPSQE